MKAKIATGIAIVGWLFLVIIGQGTAQDALPDCAFTQSNGDVDLRIGAVLVDWYTGIGCTENIDEVFNVASVPKIFVAATVYEQVADGQISLSDTMRFSNDYWMGGGNACLTEGQLNLAITIQRLIELMINCSDNAATWMLMDYVGWGTVQGYIDRLGIADIGPVLPYAFVDRTKLSFLDERWNDVPAAMASRFYRQRMTNGLAAYFGTTPERPDRTTWLMMNQRYFETTEYNTITPRALAAYIERLRDDLYSGGTAGFVARNVFEVMLFTQRQYSVQALPGTVYIASKNGFDRGLLAELNVMFSSVEPMLPQGLVIVLSQYKQIDEANGAIPGPFGGGLNEYFRSLSPQIRQVLFPAYREVPPRQVGAVRTVLFNDPSQILNCWNEHFAGNFAEVNVSPLETCFQSMPPRITFPVNQDLGMAVVLRGLGNADTRFVFIFESPDGRIFSYQEDRRGVNASAIYWYHPLDMPGVWKVDIYMNMRHVYETTIVAQQR